MDIILGGLKWQTCLCYSDYIVVFSVDSPSPIAGLEEVLECLTNAGLQLNIKKCHFGTHQLTILGHVVFKEGILPDLDKLRAVPEYSTPSTPKELRSFIGLR